MSVLKLFGFEDLNSLKAQLGQISPADVANPKLKRQLGKLQGKQGGFSLLELLIVVAIIAAIAAASSIMINGADKNAKAAVNADAIDAAFKSIASYKVLNNAYPDKFDSLIQGTLDNGSAAKFLHAGLLPGATNPLLTAGAVLGATRADALTSSGIRYAMVLTAIAGAACANLGPSAVAADYTTVLRNKSLQQLAGDLFKIGLGTVTAQGCGASAAITSNSKLLVVASAYVQRININLQQSARLVAFGIGPSATLFNPNYAGALNRPGQDSTVPSDKYNRYVALFETGTTATPSTEATLYGVVSARGKTFDQELGTWNGVL